MTEIDMLIALLHSGGNISGTGRGFFETTFNSLAFFRFDPLYRDLAYRVGNVIGARVLKIDHGLPIACWIAATMLG